VKLDEFLNVRKFGQLPYVREFQSSTRHYFLRRLVESTNFGYLWQARRCGDQYRQRGLRSVYNGYGQYLSCWKLGLADVYGTSVARELLQFSDNGRRPDWVRSHAQRRHTPNVAL